jgi:phosphate transport system permease protein
VAVGQAPSEVAYEGPLKAVFDAKVVEAKRIDGIVSYSVLGLAGLLALAGFLLATPRINTEFRARNRVEGWIIGVLFACSAVAVLTTVGIVASLIYDSMRFFSSVPDHRVPVRDPVEPRRPPSAPTRSASSGAFGALPLFAGTFLIMIIAMFVAAPVGLFSAIYLSEYAGPGVPRGGQADAGDPRRRADRGLRLLRRPDRRPGLPRLLQRASASMLAGGPLDGLGQYLMLVQNQMALVAGMVMGIMLIPFVSSLSDDIINAVPQSLRDGSYAMGATKSETVKRVLLPAALPGVAWAPCCWPCRGRSARP